MVFFSFYFDLSLVGMLSDLGAYDDVEVCGSWCMRINIVEVRQKWRELMKSG